MKIIRLVSLFLTTAFLCLFPATAFAAGSFTWTVAPTLNNTNCSPSASGTGQYQVCAGYGHDVFVSSDYGSTWADKTALGSHSWSTTFVSATGKYMVVAGNGTDIFESTDYGASWNDLSGAGSQSWSGIAISQDGTYLAALDQTGQVTLSTNGGGAWNPVTVSGASGLNAVSMSASGQYIEVSSGSDIYTSSNYGSAWAQTEGAAPAGGTWNQNFSSPSGQYVVAATLAGSVAVSIDYGQTWIIHNIPGSSQINVAVISSTGQDIVAIGDGLYESYDGGQTWTTDTGVSSFTWAAISASSDLSRVMAEDANNVYEGVNNALYIPPPSNPSNSSNGSGSSNSKSTPKDPDTGYGTPAKSNLLITSFLLVSTSVLIYGLRLKKRSS